MCIAIYKPAGKVLSRELLKNCFDNNSDGCGFSYVQTDNEGNSHLKAKKTMYFEVFYRQYLRATRLEPTSPFLIHFRIGTHGVLSRYNCHPFIIDKKHHFIHNGIIHKMPACAKKKKSDTQIFNDVILKKLGEGWFYNEAILALIEDYIGAGSKLIFLNVDKDVVICNMKAGVWEDDVWFSNSSYKERKVYNNYSKSSYYNTHSWKKEEKEEKKLLPFVKEKKETVGQKVVNFATDTLGYGRSLTLFPEDEHDEVDQQFLDSLEESKAIERDSTCFVCGIVDITGGIHNVPLDGYFTPMCAACENTYNKHGMAGLTEQ
jgi:predicted glutamine amidotransferase